MYYTSVACVGDNILLRYIDKGKRMHKKVRFGPSLFIQSDKPTPYKTIYGKYVGKVDFPVISEAKEFIDQYKNADNFPIFGNQNWEYCFIGQFFPGEIQWNIEDIRVANIDIEVGSENGMPSVENAIEPITAITMKMSGKTTAFGCGDYTPPKHVDYIKCDDELDLIERFITFWSSDYPDAITGWFAKFFDIPYIINRIINLFGHDTAKKLSPWGLYYKRETILMGKSQTNYIITGIATLDYLELYRKFSPYGASRENYKLDYICSEEIGEQKLSYEEYGSLHNLYKENFQKFMDYNIRDVELVDKLDADQKLLKLAFTLAYNAKSNYDDVFTQVRMWDNIIYNFLWNKNIIIPPKKHTPKVAFEGAYVKEPILGKHKWVVSFDLTSLYPHLMMQYNLSPETLLDKKSLVQPLQQFLQQDINVNNLLNQSIDTSILKQYHTTVTPNGQLFQTDYEGFMIAILNYMFSQRQTYKKQMLDAERELEQRKNTATEQELHNIRNKITEFDIFQRVIKICLNSLYGSLGNEYSRFFDVRLAAAVTTSGQLAIRWIQQHINKYLNEILQTENMDYVIASDTDSIYIGLDRLVNRVFKKTEEHSLPSTDAVITFLDKVCATKLQPFIDRSYQDLARYTNAYAQKMIMKREKLADIGICVSGKNYIWNVWDSEGIRYSEPKIKAVGLKMIKSNTPEAARKKLKTILKLIVDDKEPDLHAFVSQFRQEFNKLSIEDIATPTGMNGLNVYSDENTIYKKGTSINIKGSLLYNKLLVDKKLTKKYPLIQDGEKIKYVYLKLPNPLKDEMIAFPHILPKEFGLHDFVDKEKQFDKAFISPLKAVLDVINWTPEEVSSLEGFFV